MQTVRSILVTWQVHTFLLIFSSATFVSWAATWFSYAVLMNMELPLQ